MANDDETTKRLDAIQTQVDRIAKQSAYTVSSEDRIKGAVTDELSKISETWRIYRDTINRAINYLNHEVVNLIDRADRDDKVRLDRQAKLDGTLESLQKEMRLIRRTQWLRIGIEIALVLIGIAYLIGLRS